MGIRTEIPSDREAIRAIHLASFPGPDEADLVDRLRADGDAVISLVAVVEDRVIGHVMFSKMTAPFRALGLAPVAVLAEHRRKGYAARLIEEGLRRAAADGRQGVFVLGDTRYYGRFGFSADAAKDFQSSYAGEHFMALALNGKSLPVHTGRVDYAPAFAALG